MSEQHETRFELAVSALGLLSSLALFIVLVLLVYKHPFPHFALAPTLPTVILDPDVLTAALSSFIGVEGVLALIGVLIVMLSTVIACGAILRGER